MKLSKKLIDELTNFLVTNIESKALDGITYVLALKENKELIKSCLNIRDIAEESGLKKNEVFRAYEVSNGWIFDMDLNVARYISAQLCKVVAKDKGLALDNPDLIGDRPAARRKEDINKLIKYCISRHKEGKRSLEVALFSRNAVPKITLTGYGGVKGNTSGDLVVTYNAYAIRHWDIGEVNEGLLPHGIWIAKVKPCEVLPSKTGVRFVLDLGVK